MSGELTWTTAIDGSEGATQRSGLVRHLVRKSEAQSFDALSDLHRLAPFGESMAAPTPQTTRSPTTRQYIRRVTMKSFKELTTQDERSLLSRVWDSAPTVYSSQKQRRLTFRKPSKQSSNLLFQLPMRDSTGVFAQLIPVASSTTRPSLRAVTSGSSSCNRHSPNVS